MNVNLWELYEDHPSFAEATLALNDAWAEAKRIAPELPSKERANLAERHVYQVMEKWRDVGALDSEPFYLLSKRVCAHFGCTGSFV